MRAPIGLVTDSNSQIPDWMVAHFDVEVVPIVVTIDGVEYLEGVELDADGFYDRYAERVEPDISTSQPAPAAFSDAFARLAARGATAIVSIHMGASISGTLASAAIAAADASVPVHLIDTTSASFGVSICVWQAALAIERGATVGEVEQAVGAIVPAIGTVFMVGVPHLVERGGRASDLEMAGDGIPVLAMSGGSVEVLERVSTVEDTIDVMATYAAGWGPDVTVAIGTADAASRPMTARLTVALDGLDNVAEVVHYRVGPSVGAHTGPGTIGLFVFPTLT